MATFKTSAIIELIDKTKSGAQSVIRNFSRLEKAADGFGDEADKSADKAKRSFRQFTFEQEKARNKLKSLRSDLRAGKGDFRAIEREIDDVTESLKKLNRENRDLRIGRGIGRGIRGLGRGLLRGGAVGLTGAAVGGAAATRALANQADEALKLADNTGFAVESVTALQFALGQTVTPEAVNALPAILRDLNARRGEFIRTGAGEVSSLDDELKTILASAENTEDAFVKLGTEIRSRNLDTGELANTLEKLFGEPGRQLVPFFQKSQADIDVLINRASDLGVVLSRDVAEEAVRFNDKLSETGQAIRGLGLSALGQAFGPLANVLGDRIIPAIVQLTDRVKGIEPEDIENAFRNIVGFLEDAALFVADIAQTITDFGGGFIVSGRERRALDEIGGDSQLLEEYERRLGAFTTSGERQRVAVDLINERDSMEETNRLLEQLVRQGGLGGLNQWLGGPEGEAARETSVTSADNQRSFGTRVDSGQERVGIQ